MWLAHALTLARLPLAIALWSTYGDPARSLALVVLAALTDVADGNVARWMQRRGHTRPAIGGWLDPLVDKLFVAIVLALVWFRAGAPLLVLLVGARELLLVPIAALYAARRPACRPALGELHADPIGKAATIAQFAALAAIFAAPALALPAAALAAALGLAAAAHYARRVLRS